MKTLGYDRPLYILPFDHRGSFQTKLFGWTGTLTADQTEQIAAAQRLAGGSAGVVIDFLLDYRAIDVVGAEPQGYLRYRRSHHDPVGFDVLDVVQHQARHRDHF